MTRLTNNRLSAASDGRWVSVPGFALEFVYLSAGFRSPTARSLQNIRFANLRGFPTSDTHSVAIGIRQHQAFCGLRTV